MQQKVGLNAPAFPAPLLALCEPLCYKKHAQRVPLAPRVHGLGRLHPAETTLYLNYTGGPALRGADFTIGFVRAT